MNVGGFGVSITDLLDEDVVTPFLAALDELGQELPPRRQVSCALTLRAAVDFFVMRRRGARTGLLPGGRCRVQHVAHLVCRPNRSERVGKS